MSTAAVKPNLLMRLVASLRREEPPPQPSADTTPEDRLLDSAGDSSRSKYAGRGYRAIYPRNMEALARLTGVPSAAPSVGELLGARGMERDGLENLARTNGIPQVERNLSLRAKRWRGSNGYGGVQDQMRREDPAIQRVALMWEAPAMQERDWTVETEHTGALALRVRDSVDRSLRCVRSGVGFGIVRGLLGYQLSATWRGFALSRWSFELSDTRSESGGLLAGLHIGRPIMPWAVNRWIRAEGGGWDVVLGNGYGVNRTGDTAERIPADYLLHTTFGNQGDLPEGLSLFRSFWARYSSRALFLAQQEVGFDKATTGIPVVYYPEDMLDPDVEKVQTVLEGLRSSEWANATLPMGAKVEFIDFPFKAEEISAALDQGFEEIQKGALCAEGDEQIRGQLIQAAVDAAAAEVNHKIIPALVAYNFGPQAQTRLPVLRGPRIPLMDPLDFAEYVRKGLRSGALTGTEDVEVHFRRRGGLDEMPEALKEAYADIDPVPRVGQMDKLTDPKTGEDPEDEVTPAPEDVPGQEQGT